MKLLRKSSKSAFILLLSMSAVLPAVAQGQRWSEAKANAWYEKQPLPVGSNYVPDDAVNELEMWQAPTFDPKEIDKEFGWAQDIGMNTMRVFLHDLLWAQDPDGFKMRMNHFLEIADRHHIKPIFVLLDSCWDPYPKLGPQRPPIPGVHNSGWVQSPGKQALSDPSQYPRLKAYIQGVVGAFANDDRILAWDVWNEPDNTNKGSYETEEPANKVSLVAQLLPEVFKWVREEHPTQPLTSGLWTGDWSTRETLTPVGKIQINESDIVSFHDYGWPEQFQEHVRELEQFHRPLICTEYMARGAGSLFDTILPIAVQSHVGAINWGFVEGRTQTYLPWDSWQRPYVLLKPTVWFHDIYHADGTPYRKQELLIIRRATEGSNGPRSAAP